MTEHLPPIDFEALKVSIVRIRDLQVELEAEYLKLGHRVIVEVMPKGDNDETVGN